MPRQGDVVTVTVLDPNGRNAKSRPAVIVAATADIIRTKKIVVASISTQFEAGRLPPEWIEVPWANSRHKQTGLRKASVVKCDWLTTVNVSDVRVIGHLPPKYLSEVMQQLRNLGDT